MRIFSNRKLTNILLVAGLISVSLIAWYICYSSQLVLVYNDAMSHMNMARLVVDNQKPGLAQIGSVWLPLGHILKLPLIWNEWAWHSGFAGSLVSMTSYVLMVVGIYRIVMELTGRRLASMMGAVVSAINLNMLYLQSTPLTEPLYLALFVYSAYFLIRYIKTSDVKHLLPLSFITALQIVSRYDGWFVAGVIAAIIFGDELWARQKTFKKALGQTLLFVTPVAFACILWLGWNALIFGDPLYFATGPFSAKAQQGVIEGQAGLITKSDLRVSMQAFGYGVAENVGWLIINIALAGWLLYLKPWQKVGSSLRVVAFVALISVAVFNVLALYLGFSIMNLPQLGWNPSGDSSGELFNVRYGILALPFAAVGAGLLVAKWRYVTPLILAAIVVQNVIMYQEEPISLRDGRTGSSAFVQDGIARAISEHVGPEDEVLMSTSHFNPVAFASSVPLKQFIHEGVSSRWDNTLKSPEVRADWVVTSNGSLSDPVYTELVEGQKSDFEKHYRLVYKDDRARLYQRNGLAATK